MIFGLMHVKGKDVVVMGLSDMNVQKLKEGLPILKNTAELGLQPLPLVIVWGKTETDIAKELEQNGVPIEWTAIGTDAH